MKPRSLAVLAILVVGLLAFIWFFERELPSSDERRERADRALTLDRDAVVEIEIERGGERLRLERTPAPAAQGDAAGETADDGGEADWRLVEPLAARADRGKVDSFLDSLLELSRERTLEEFDAAAVGLSEPRARVRLVADAGREQTLRVGAEVPAASRMIVQREGSGEAMVVKTSIWEEIEKGVDEWRDHSLFTGSRDDVASIDLRGPAGEVRLAARDGDWWLEAPLSDRAADDHVSSLLGAVAGLEAKAFVDAAAGSAAELGLDPAAASLELGMGGEGEPFKLEIGAPVGGEEDAKLRYGRAGGQLFTFDATLDGALERSPADWQSADWSGLEVWEIDGVTATRNGESTHFERSGGDWRRDGEKVPYNAVSDLLYGIDGLESEGLEPVAEARGDEAVVFELAAAGRTERLALRRAGDGYLGTVEGRPYGVRLAAAGVEKLLAELDAARTAVEAPPAEAPESAGDDG